MADFLQQVVAGLASGGIYALLALALVLRERERLFSYPEERPLIG